MGAWLSYFGGGLQIFLIVVSLFSGLLSIVRELQGMYRPPTDNHKRVYWRWIRIAFVLSAFILWCDAFRSMKGRETELHGAELALDKEKRKPPIVVVQSPVDPQLIKLISSINNQLKHDTGITPLKAKLLDLSKRILTFALEKSKEQPMLSMNFNTEISPSAMIDQGERYRVASMRFQSEMQSEYASAFDAEVLSAFNELRTLGGIPVSDSHFYICNSQHAGILVTTAQQCGTQLRVFADQIK